MENSYTWEYQPGSNQRSLDLNSHTLPTELWRQTGSVLKIKEFTGISDPYESPTSAELVVDTEGTEVDYCAQQVLLKLESMGLIAA